MLLGNTIFFLPHSAHLIAFSNILTKAGLEKSDVVCPNNKYRMIYLNMGHGDGASPMPRRSSSSPTPSGGLSASRPRAIRLRNEVGEGANHPLIPLAFHTVSFAAFISWNFFSAALRTSSPSDATRSGWFFKASRR